MNKSPQNVAAIVLAAGMSRRMGRLKPLLPFGDKPMLARVIESLQSCDEIDPVIVVTGHAASQIESTVFPYPVQIAHNNHYENGGMLSSVQCGVRALPPQTGAAFLALGDQPAVRVSTIKSLLQVCQENARSETGAPVILPTYRGRRGHPVLFSSSCFAEILALAPDATLKHVVQKHRAATLQIPVEDEGILLDVDTPQDYERALELWRRDQSPGESPQTE